MKNDKPPKIFISHSCMDEKAANLLVDLIEQMGIPIDGNHVYCTSTEGLGVSLRENIYSSMRKQFDDYNLFVIFVLSRSYYTRPACLNEMGASWILDLPDTSILLPGFDFKDIAGALDKNNIAIKIDAPDSASRLNELRERLCKFMGIEIRSDAHTMSRWELKRNTFIKEVKVLSPSTPETEIDVLRKEVDVLKTKLQGLKNSQKTDNTVGSAQNMSQKVTAAQVISRFMARPLAWNGKSFTGTFLFGTQPNSYAEPMSDWLCEELKLTPGYPITAKCVEAKRGAQIRIFADGENADIIADIKERTEVELVLKAVYFTYEDYDNCNFGAPAIRDYFIFEVEKISCFIVYRN